MTVAKSILLTTIILGVTPLAQADAKVDYILHCSGCHMPDGSGLVNVVPSLHGTLGRIVSEPEGRSYIVRVPGSSQAPISDEKLTEVLNWMLTKFSSDTLPENFRPLTVSEVKRARGKLLADPLKYRARTFPGY